MSRRLIAPYVTEEIVIVPAMLTAVALTVGKRVRWSNAQLTRTAVSVTVALPVPAASVPVKVLWCER